MSRPQLTVDTNQPYGNAADVSIVENEGVVELSFAAHPHGGPECLWFCFRLARTGGTKAGGPIRLVLKHPDNMLGGSDLTKLRPVVRRKGEDWERLAAGDVEVLPDGRRSLSWGLDAPRTWVEIAYCYPYGPPDVDALIDEPDGLWQADAIGVSQQGRPILRLSNRYSEEGHDTPGLYLVARQHSGETPGSWVLDGFLRQIAALGEAAPLVWAVPLSNIDGVAGGDYGKDNFPYDLNRAWGLPPMRHETLVIQRDIQRWVARCRPVLGIDFHAPGACEADGVYCYLPKPKHHPERHEEALPWAAAMEQALKPDFAADPFGRVADYRSRWETPSFVSHLCARHEVCALTIETPYALVKDRVLTRDDYGEVGRRIAAGAVKPTAAAARTNSSTG